MHCPMCGIEAVVVNGRCTNCGELSPSEFAGNPRIAGALFRAKLRTRVAAISWIAVVMFTVGTLIDASRHGFEPQVSILIALVMFAGIAVILTVSAWKLLKISSQAAIVGLMALYAQLLATILLTFGGDSKFFLLFLIALFLGHDALRGIRAFQKVMAIEQSK